MPRPQRKAPPYDVGAARALLRRQAGVASRQQLRDLGVTRHDLERLLRRRAVRRLSSGIVTEQLGALSPLQVAWWACLRYADSAVADLSALQLARDGSGGRLTLPVHVAVPAGRGSPPLPQVVLHRVSRIESLVVRAGLPRMRAEHAALRAAAAQSSINAVVSTLADAVNWRATKSKQLQAALLDLPRLPRRQLIHEVVADLIAGACSVLERGYLLDVEQAHGLPAGERQEPRKSAAGWEFRDVVYPGCGLVVELDGRAFHAGKAAREKDMERDLDDLVAGRDSARLGYAQIFDTPCRTAAKVALLLQQRGWQGQPVPCGPGCQLAS